MSAPVDSSVVLGLPEKSLLAEFNRAGVLAPADVHVARRLGRLAGETDELVALAAAFAVRAPRVGHVRVELTSVRETAEGEVEEDEVDLDGLPWPDAPVWVERVASSALVALGEEPTVVAPLRLVGSALYLDRYWRDERAVAADLLARARALPMRGADAGGTTGDGGGAGFAKSVTEALTNETDPEQRWAVAMALLRGLAVIAGGPGTGKTTTVARLIGLLAEQAEDSGGELPLVALAAPTGKAANRMQEAVRAATRSVATSGAARALLENLEAATIHRLLRQRPDNASRFRYNRYNRLPHDIVVIDETSMLSLWLMARLVEAVRHDARLVLVGDPEQLASVEAGAVLGDVVGPASSRLRMHAGARTELEEMTGVGLDVVEVPEQASEIGDSVVVLRTNHRFRGALAELAAAVRSGDADAVVSVLGEGDETVEWLACDLADVPEPATGVLEPLRVLACDAGRYLFSAARVGDRRGALEALSSWRILCAHRRGPAGVSSWNARVVQWLADEIEGFSADGEWYVGRPVVVTKNDYSLRLFNGDTGVIVARAEGGIAAGFDRGLVSPSRLSDVDTVYATTVHKAQGSEFDQVAVVLPQATSRILTRELLYTAVTRAKRCLVVVGGEQSVRAAVARPIARASGLTARLWGGAEV